MKLFLLLILGCAVMIVPTLAQAVSSGHYQLRDYGFGGGGFSGSSSNYKMEGLSGETEYGNPGSTDYKVGLGMNFVQQSHVPAAPTVSNSSSFYNMLHIVIDTGNNPSDSFFAITASNDNFVSNFQYVQNDNTLGPTLGSEDWQTYASWGGASGFDVIGLSPGVTYSFKVTARQGDFTQSPYSPTGSASTVSSTLSFDLDISSTDSETTAPYTLAIGTLTPGSVTTSTNKIWVDLSTNASNGGMVYIYSSNAGLTSSTAGYTISAASADLSSAGSGYGARYSSVAQSSGGPMEVLSPYAGAGNNVGVVDSSKRLIFDSSGAPVASGRMSFELKAKASSTTPAATDYADVLTVVAAGSF